MLDTILPRLEECYMYIRDWESNPALVIQMNSDSSSHNGLSLTVMTFFTVLVIHTDRSLKSVIIVSSHLPSNRFSCEKIKSSAIRSRRRSRKKRHRFGKDGRHHRPNKVLNSDAVPEMISPNV